MIIEAYHTLRLIVNHVGLQGFQLLKALLVGRRVPGSLQGLGLSAALEGQPGTTSNSMPNKKLNVKGKGKNKTKQGVNAPKETSSARNLVVNGSAGTSIWSCAKTRSQEDDALVVITSVLIRNANRPAVEASVLGEMACVG